MMVARFFSAVCVFCMYLFKSTLTEDANEITNFKFGNSCFIGNITTPNVDEFEAEAGDVDTQNYPLLNCTKIERDFLMTQKIFLLEIKSLILTNSSILFDDILTFLPNLKVLELKQSTISRTNNKLPSITDLIITGNVLYTVPHYLLNAFPSLQHLVLTDNQIKSVPGNIFDNSTDLQTINLDSNPIENINFTWFTYKQNVKNLILRSTHIQNISREFRQAIYLEYIDLSDNQIVQIGVKSFRRAANLTTLILSNNRISYVHPKAFKGTTALKYLDLSNNQIETIYEGTFRYMPADQLSVDLWENLIACDCHLAWLYRWKIELSQIGAYPEIRFTCRSPPRNYGKRLSLTQKDDHALTEKDLTCSTDSSTTSRPMTITCPKDCDCFLSKEDYQRYQNSQKPKDVAFPLTICNERKLAEIPSSTDQNTKGLIMETNLLTTVDLRQLGKYKSLTVINLQDNNISELSADREIICENVQVLSLENNQITGITKGFFKSFPLLRKLRLYNNHIKKINDGVFMHNPFLTKLILGPNPFLTNFTGNFMQNLPLINLGLRGSNLLKVPNAIKNKTNLLNLDLSDNNITVIPSGAFTNCSTLKNLLLQNNNIKEIHEFAFKNLFNLAAVDLSENGLTHLPSLVFEHTGEDFFQIDLWQNPFRCDCKMADFFHWIKYMSIKHGDSTEIRYMCVQPPRMAGIISTHTTASDYVCLANETDSVKAASRKESIVQFTSNGYTKSQLILAVSITIIACTCVYVCIQIYCKYHTKAPTNYGTGIFKRQKFRPLNDSGQRDHFDDNNLESEESQY